MSLLQMKAFLREYLQLPRKVLVVAGGRLFNSLGSFVVILTTPLFIQHLQMSPAQAGTWLFACSAAFLGGSLAAGAVLDRVNKVWVLGGTLALNALAFGVGAISESSVAVPAAMVAGYFFHGAWRPSMAAIAADETTADQHAIAFSLMYFVHNIGFLVAPVAAGWLFATSPRLVHLGDAISSLLSAAIVLLGTGTVLTARAGRSSDGANVVPAATAAVDQAIPDTGATVAPRSTGRFLPALLRDRVLLAFIGAMVFLQLTYAQHQFALPLQLIEEMGQVGTARFATLMAFNAGVVIVLAPFLTALTRKMRSSAGITWAAVAQLVGFGMLAWVRGYGWYFASVLIWTIGEILGAIHISVFIVSRAPERMRGRYVGATPVIFSAAGMLSPFLGGWLVELAGTRAVWLVTAIMCSAAVTILLIVDRYVVTAHRNAS